MDRRLLRLKQKMQRLSMRLNLLIDLVFLPFLTTRLLYRSSFVTCYFGCVVHVHNSLSCWLNKVKKMAYATLELYVVDDQAIKNIG